jgi:hypothetical protein
MNRTTIYREELLCFLDRDEDFSNMQEWINSQPEFNQPDIYRELQAIFKELYEKTGEKDWIEKAKQIADNIDAFEDVLLDEKLAKALFRIELEKIEFDPEKASEFLALIREPIIKSIISNTEDNKEMREIAQKAIESEKKLGIYDPANWIDIL